jgi:predicted component of type VI protein secretion system
MATEAQINANRANAQHSTGPRMCPRTQRASARSHARSINRPHLQKDLRNLALQERRLRAQLAKFVAELAKFVAELTQLQEEREALQFQRRNRVMNPVGREMGFKPPANFAELFGFEFVRQESLAELTIWKEVVV